MVVSDPKSCCENIIAFFKSKPVCLFAGAGVGQRAGLPSWDGLLNHLCSVAQRFSPELSIVMEKRVEKGLFIEAADLYKNSIEILEGVKFAELAQPFENNPNYTPVKLRALMALPFNAVVTTNYDKAIHDAFFMLYERQRESGMNLKAPDLVELGDASLKQAIYYRNFFIARIHGRAEIPSTMVIDTNDYKQLDNNADYQDFLLHILKSYHCLFLGFSFLDPAITKILDLMDRILAKPYPRVHLAFIPGDESNPLAARLSRFNIRVIYYDKRNGHELLWKGIKEAQKKLRLESREISRSSLNFTDLRHFIATCYARIKLEKDIKPLRDLVIEGMIADIVISAGLDGLTVESLLAKLQKYVSLSIDQLSKLTDRILPELAINKVCVINKNRIRCRSINTSLYHATIGRLAEGALKRLYVREGINFDDNLKKDTEKIINRILAGRGWDLGAHYAGGVSASTFDAWPLIEDEIRRTLSDVRPVILEPLANSLLDLLRHPDDAEAEILADLGRVAFGLELVLNNSRNAWQQHNLLPDTIYLDSNVLMPAIVEGHPYSKIYFDSVSRMREAVKKAHKDIKLFVAEPFLNEIISHKNRAIEEVNSCNLENPLELEKIAIAFGTENINVFIGAYATWVGRLHNPVSFRKFLTENAPYNNETQLAAYLLKRSINPIKLSFSSGDETAQYDKVRNELHIAYEERAHLYKDVQIKPRVLIDHEASQLTRLILDIQKGLKPIFVTADKRLMNLCRGPVLGRCSANLMSHLGFVQMVDLVLGLDTDRKALSRLMWNVSISNEKTAIRNYLIDRALRHRDEALSKAMWEVVDRIAEEAEEEAKQKKISILPANRSDHIEATAFLDRYEQDFFKHMDEVIKSWSKEK